MSIYKSIAKNYVANVFSMGINFLNQIAMVPLFISLWGIDKYADWILITALSSFFTMTNVGLNTVTNNEFVIRYQQKEFDVCTRLLTNAFFFVLIVGGLLIFVSLIISFTCGFQEILNTKVFSGTETSVSFVLLLFNVFVKMYNGIYAGIFNAVSKTHLIINVGNIIRLVEILILVLGILLKYNIIVVLIIYCIPALVNIGFSHFYTKRWFDASLKSGNFHVSTFKAMLKPSVAFMMMPLGFAVQNQGMVFIVNAMLGAPILVAYTTTRTLVNFLRQLMNMLANAMWPEISRTYGQRDFRVLTNIYYHSLIITFVTTVTSIVLLLIFGQWIYIVWTKNAVIFDYAFFAGMLSVLLISCLWGLSSIIPLATNTHTRFSMVFLLTQIAGVALSFVCLKIYPHLTLIPVALFITEFVLFVFIIKENNRFLGNNLNDMQIELWRKIKFLIIKTKTCKYFHIK
jgi:O-antigen/teichoic acid export membrane protein